MASKKKIKRHLLNLSDQNKHKKSWRILNKKYSSKYRKYIYHIACDCQDLKLRIHAIHLLLYTGDNSYMKIIKNGLLVEDSEFLYSLVMFSRHVKKQDVVSLLISLIMRPGRLQKYELQYAALSALQEIGLISIPAIVKLLITENENLSSELKSHLDEVTSMICDDAIKLSIRQIE